MSGFERVADDLYRRLYEDEDARVCRDISDAACRVVVGGITALVQQVSTGAAILLLSLAAFVAAWLARRLPEVQ